MSNNSLEDIGKTFSDMCVISENEKTFQGVIQWNIPQRELKKQLEGSGRAIQSNTFSIGSSSFCSFYILFRTNVWDCINPQDPSTYLESRSKPLSASIVFNNKFPDSAWIKGKIYFDEIDVHGEISVSGKTFQKKIEISMPCTPLDSENLIFLCDGGQVTMYCSLKILLKDVKCAFDKKVITYAESRYYDCNKEIKHDFSDVSISIGDHQIMAHKVVLAQIPYFVELFEANESEKHFELTDIDHEIFNYVLTYLYKGEIPKLSFKLACELYIVAGDLKISNLKDMCSSYLGANLNDINVIITLKLSHEYEDAALKNECFKFIKRSDPETLTKQSIIL